MVPCVQDAGGCGGREGIAIEETRHPWDRRSLSATKLTREAIRHHPQQQRPKQHPDHQRGEQDARPGFFLSLSHLGALLSARSMPAVRRASARAPYPPAHAWCCVAQQACAEAYFRYLNRVALEMPYSSISALIGTPR